MALVLVVVAATNRIGSFAEACSDPADAVAVGNSFSLPDFGGYYCCCCYCPLVEAENDLWHGADIAEVERKMEELPHWMEVRFSGPSSVKAERRKHFASAVLAAVGIVVVAAGNVVVVGRNDEIAGRLGY